jgi:hypothetical protein
LVFSRMTVPTMNITVKAKAIAASAGASMANSK